MNIFKKTIACIFFAAAGTLAFAQLPARYDIITINSDSNNEKGIYDMPNNASGRYVLSLGHMGFGDEDVQINLDPISELFIPLGNTVDEALAKLLEIQEMYKSEPESVFETTGCLGIGVPNGDLQKIKIRFRKIFLTRQLEFILVQNDATRATFIQRSDFNSLVSGFKFHKKLHPND